MAWLLYNCNDKYHQRKSIVYSKRFIPEFRYSDTWQMNFYPVQAVWWCHVSVNGHIQKPWHQSLLPCRCWNIAGCSRARAAVQSKLKIPRQSHDFDTGKQPCKSVKPKEKAEAVSPPGHVLCSGFSKSKSLLNQTFHPSSWQYHGLMVGTSQTIPGVWAEQNMNRNFTL